MVDGIYGASEDNSRLDKDQVIRWAFQHIDFDENAGDKALMVGDRWTDADGAKRAVWTASAVAGAMRSPESSKPMAHTVFWIR